MGTVTFKGSKVALEGSFLKPGDIAPDFNLATRDLQTTTLSAFSGKAKLIATVVSLDTSVCLLELKKMNEMAKTHPNAVFLIISKDLPFRQKQICLDEKIQNIVVLSDCRPSSNFGKNYGVYIGDGPLAGLLTRSIIVLDEHDKVVYSELVPEITKEPDIEKAFSFMGRHSHK